MVYNLYIIREEGRDYKGGTEGRRGGGILVSFIVRFKLRIRLVRFCWWASTICFIGELVLEASCISGCGKVPGPGVLDMAATVAKVDDQLYSVWNCEYDGDFRGCRSAWFRLTC